MTAKWLLCRARRPEAAARMYCLPHSGGSAGEFLFWADELPGLEVWGVQPPGRGHRLDEDPLTSMADLVHAIVTEVEFEPPYVLFGHSLGAAVAYEVALALRERGRPLPERLYASAHEAPHRHVGDPALRDLDDVALLDELAHRYGAVPPELRDDPEWCELVLGGLRADLRIVADYTARPAEPLPFPVVALGGADDDVPEPDLADWAACTSGEFTHRLFPGGHFYFRENNREFLDFLRTDTLARAAR
jgi:surfactin synthase thioesterase subunit